MIYAVNVTQTIYRLYYVNRKQCKIAETMNSDYRNLDINSSIVRILMVLYTSLRPFKTNYIGNLSILFHNLKIANILIKALLQNHRVHDEYPPRLVCVGCGALMD